MGVIEIDVTERELKALESAAAKKGMSVDDFVVFAAMKVVNDIKDKAKQCIKPDLKLIK